MDARDDMEMRSGSWTFSKPCMRQDKNYPNGHLFFHGAVSLKLGSTQIHVAVCGVYR